MNGNPSAAAPAAGTGARYFGAVMSAMVTPFDRDGRLDLDAAQRLPRWLADRGNDGLVVAATTGEASTLSDNERRDLVRRAREINAGLLESFRFLDSDDSGFSMSIKTIKAMLRTLGQDVGECRLALPPAPPGTQARAREVWQRLSA